MICESVANLSACRKYILLKIPATRQKFAIWGGDQSFSGLHQSNNIFFRFRVLNRVPNCNYLLSFFFVLWRGHSSADPLTVDIISHQFGADIAHLNFTRDRL